MQKHVVFLLTSLNNNHAKNRIVEFVKNGFDVSVYGFIRKGSDVTVDFPTQYHVLGEIEDSNYWGRILKYLTALIKIGKVFSQKKTVAYICGLDLALFFRLTNPGFEYIYEECDLTHTYVKYFKGILERCDKSIIKHSLLTISTSEGFLQYHYRDDIPSNVLIVPNRLDPSITDFRTISKKVDINNLSIGFVGMPRFNTILNFIDVFCRNFPNHQLHVFGGPISPTFEALRKYPNCYFHGFFKNPNDLPEIYSKIDLLLATYDTSIDNVKYAEPNKLFEAIYFEKPIIVSTNTYLASKVKKLGIGFDINAMDESEIVTFINNLSLNDINEVIHTAKQVDKKELLNDNKELYSRLKVLLEVKHTC